MKLSRAQIVVTLGPASSARAVLTALIAHGLDVARLNFAWGTLAERAAQIKLVRELAAAAGRAIPIIQDLPGPRVPAGAAHTYDAVAARLTPADEQALAFGAEHKLDYVALSFVGGAADVMAGRAAITRAGGAQKLIAKIERQAAVAAIDEIIAASDAIMIARGDLGAEIPLEQIPFVQAEIIKKCKAVGKPVIVATQMMLSMVTSPTPTRAEVTDVASAILAGADAVMLSEETTVGQYPEETIAMMEKIISEAERHTTPTINPL